MMKAAAQSSNQTQALEQQNYSLKEMVALRNEEITLLHEQIRHLKACLYGRKSEKDVFLLEDSGQQSLFAVEDVEAAKPAKDADKEVEIGAHKRKRRGLPDHLKREFTIIDLSEEEKKCCGVEMVKIGEETAERLVHKPAEMYVNVEVRPKYACSVCQGLETEGVPVKIAPLPPRIIEKSYATPSLLAQILTARFVDGLPYYRQEKQYERYGVPLNRSLMCAWVIKVADKCLPLFKLLEQAARAGPLLGVDETTFQVMNELGRSNKTKSYMWILRGGAPEKPVILFYYHPKRSGDFARVLLKDYKGYVQTDGYAAYNYLDKTRDVVHLGCWAHVRRKFVAVAKAHRGPKRSQPTYANNVITLIKELYAVETITREKELPEDEFLALRKREAMPVLNRIRALLDNLDGKAPPKSLLGKAVHYALSNWSRVTRYLEQPYLRPDNNLVENAIRPFVIGRKNSLFSGHPTGARATALLYSLVESAKANGWSPYAYLLYMLENLPQAQTVQDYLALLPTAPPPSERR